MQHSLWFPADLPSWIPPRRFCCVAQTTVTMTLFTPRAIQWMLQYVSVSSSTPDHLCNTTCTIPNIKHFALYCNVITVLELYVLLSFFSPFVWTVIHSCSGSWGRRAAGGAGGIQRRRTAIQKQPLYVQWRRRLRYPRRPPSEVVFCFLSLL